MIFSSMQKSTALCRRADLMTSPQFGRRDSPANPVTESAAPTSPSTRSEHLRCSVTALIMFRKPPSAISCAACTPSEKTYSVVLDDQVTVCSSVSQAPFSHPLCRLHTTGKDIYSIILDRLKQLNTDYLQKETACLPQVSFDVFQVVVFGSLPSCRLQEHPCA